MSKFPLPQINTPQIEGHAIQMWRPEFVSLQVCHLKNGNTVVTYSQTGREPVMFDMDAEATAAFIALLTNTTQPTAAGQGA